MPFISDSWPNFADGISQQPVLLRTPTQGDEQINGLSDPALGLSKRPCTEHLAKIGDYATPNLFGTTITRSATEAYFLLIAANSVPTLNDTTSGASVAVNVTEATDHEILTITFSTTTATVTTASAHGLSSLDKVQINSAEVTAGTNTYNGPFTITYTGATTFTYPIVEPSVAASGSPTFAQIFESTMSGAELVSYNAIVDYLKVADPQTNLRSVSIADETYLLNKSTTVAKTTTLTTNRDYKEGVVHVKVGAFGTTYTITLQATDFAHSTSESGTDVSELVTRNTAITDSLVTALNNGVAATYNQDSNQETSFSATSGGSAITPTITVRHRKGESVIHFKSATLTDTFTLEGKDSRDYGHMMSFQGSVGDFAKLPTKGPTTIDGWEIKVSGDFAKDQDDYYVSAVRNASTGEVTYTESAKDNEKHQFNATTLPRRLVRNSDGSYSLKETAWTARVSGDDTTNPYPKFAGNTIADIFYHQSRLGFLSGETLHLSETNEYGNFFLTTVLTPLATAPIELSSAGTEISVLEYALPYSESLLMFSKLNQPVLRAPDVLTASSAALRISTRFEASLKAKPASSGRFIFFAEKRGSHCGIREYFTDSNTNTMDAAQITMHVPKYIAGEAVQLLASSNSDILCIRTDDADSEETVWVYRYTWLGAQKAQASWSKWTFDGKVRAMGFVESDLLLILERGSKSYLERLHLGRDSAASENDMSSAMHLDRRVKLTSDSSFDTFHSSYYQDAGTGVAATVTNCVSLSNVTTCTTTAAHGVIVGNAVTIAGNSVAAHNATHLVTEIPSTTTFKYALTTADATGTGGTSTLQNSTLIYIDKAGDAKTATEVGALTLSASVPIWVGIPYEFKYRISEPVVRLKQNEAATTSGRIQLRTMSVNYADSGYFRVQIKPQGHDVTVAGVTMRDVATHTFNGRIVGAAANVTDTTPILSGTFRFPVYSISTGVQVEITSSEWMPCSFQGGEWEAQYYTRSGRIK